MSKISQGTKLEVGMVVEGSFQVSRSRPVLAFSGRVVSARQVDNWGRAADSAEAVIEIDDPETLANAAYDGAEGRDQIFVVLTADYRVADGRIVD